MNSERLLVIDDEADFGTFVRRVAERLAFDVEVTTRAEEFKTAYARFDPTVIVLDVVMPDVDGIELVRWLGSQGCQARIVIISGFDPNYARAAQSMGDFAGLKSIVRLKKPVNVAELENALKGEPAPPRPWAFRATFGGRMPVKHRREQRRHGFAQGGRAQNLDFVAQAHQFARADIARFDRHRASDPAAAVGLRGGAQGHVQHVRAELFQKAHAFGREAHFGLGAVHPGLVIARRLVPMRGEIEIARPGEFFVGDLRLDDGRHAIGPNG